MTPPVGFVARREAGTEWWLREADAAWLDELLRGITGRAPRGARALYGGRGGTRLVSVGERRVVVRPCRRGGLPARFVRDVHLGWRPRPFRELVETVALRARGAPVVAACGAAVRWIVPGCYRGWLVTDYVEGARTLWQWLAAAPPPEEREAVWTAVGRAVRSLHACGGRHPDLNLNNVLVFPGASGWEVRLIDFDRPPGAGLARRGAELDRLRRSARKLDPSGRVVAEAELARMTAAYAAPEPA